MECLVERDKDEVRFGCVGALRRAHVEHEQATVVLNHVWKHDPRRDQQDPTADVGCEPDECGHERESVGRDVRKERAPVNGVPSEAAVLVLRLPVGLQREVADEVAHDEDREDLGPRHLGTIYT